MQYIKSVVVGDGGVGKTCLVTTYNTNSFPSEYVPTIADACVTNVKVNNKLVNVAFWDTAGQEEYDQLRPLAYPQSDVFFVCFDVANRSSFENIHRKWLPEVNHHCPNVPKVLVACKIDLRSSSTLDCVTSEEGSKLAKENGLYYQETSALTRQGLSDFFYNGFVAALNTKKGMHLQ